MPTETSNLFMTIQIDRRSDEYVVHCHGKLVSGACTYLHDEVFPLISRGKRIVIDLAGVPWMDSRGLGAVVRLHVAAKNSECQLRLFNVGPRVQQLLSLTHLLDVLCDVP